MVIIEFNVLHWRYCYFCRFESKCITLHSVCTSTGMVGALAAGTVQDKLGRKKYGIYIENIIEINLCGLYSY